VATCGFIAPMKPRLETSLPTGAGWLYELELEGRRTVAVKQGAHVSLHSLNAKQLDLPALEQAVAQLPCKTATLDGQVVALDAQGRPTFAREPGPGPHPALLQAYYLFDLMFLDGMNLVAQPLAERKRLLSRLLAQSNSGLLRLCGSLHGTPAELLEHAKALGLEGVVAKRADSRYEADVRSGAWVKVKCEAGRRGRASAKTPS